MLLGFMNKITYKNNYTIDTVADTCKEVLVRGKLYLDKG